MRFEVEAKESNPNVKRVSIVPSHPDGVFIFRDSHYGLRAVGKIGIALDDEVVERIASGDISEKDFFTFGKDSHTFVPESGTLVADIDTKLFRTERVIIPQFQEMIPVSLD